MKRRTFIKNSTAAGTVIMMAPASLMKSWGNNQTAISLENGFSVPPDSAKPWVWWHWVDENVTKEGITRDLEWMHRIGIGGMQMFDTGFNIGAFIDKPVKFRSPEWLEMLRHAASEAERLGLKMAMQSDSGSSTTGGTWVRPEEAMKKYVWSELYVAGPETYSGKLPQPPAVNGGFQNTEASGRMSFGTPPENPEPDPTYYADSAVIAYRLPDDEIRMTDLSPVVTSNAGSLDFTPLSDGDMTTSVTIPLPEDGSPAWIQIEFEEPFTSRAITLAGQTNGEIMISDDGLNFRNIATIRGQGGGGFGRRSSASVTYAFPEASARFYRIGFTGEAQGGMPGFGGPGGPGGAMENQAQNKVIMLSLLELHNGSRVHRWEDKAYFGSLYDYETVPTPDADPGTVIPKDSVTDLTSEISADGSLTWEVPEGRWVIMRLGYSLEGTKNHPAMASAEGFECDKLSPVYVESYIKTYLEPVAEALGPLYGTTFKYLLIDSWEAGALNWTDEMLREFRQRRGYDPLPYLPVLSGRVVESADVSDRFLWDYRRTISDMIADNHYGVIAHYLHERGLGLYSEAAGLGLPTLEDGLLNKGKVDIPMGEFWMQYPDRRLRDQDEADIREAANAAHIYGTNIAAAESFTTAQIVAWKQAPSYLKWGADYTMALGLNQFIIHTSVHQPFERKPGMTLHVAGQHFSRHATWAEQAGPFISYLARSSFLLQQGLYVGDICYYYGESTPVTVPYTHNIRPEPPAGYGYDFINTDILINESSVENGRFTLTGGMKYHILVLPETVRMTPHVARKIKELVEAGATVVGPKPVMSPSLADYPSSDKEVAGIADALWGDLDGKSRTERMAGKGRIVWGKSLEDVLAAENLTPDFKYESSNGASLVWIHRQDGDTHIFFVASQSGNSEEFNVSLRVEGKIPELWHSDTGEKGPAAYSFTGGRTEVPLELEPYGSVFVVFREKAVSSSRQLPQTVEKEAGTLIGPWIVSFVPGWGAPPEVNMEKLLSWKEHSDEGVRHYSGTATYTKTFQAPGSWFVNEGRIILDLGEVKEIAEVFLNGSGMGILWKPPFRVDITDALKQGVNKLEIRVTNLWLNRLIGDVALPGDERYTFAFALLTSANAEDEYKNAELMDSGLIGPVTVKLIT